MAYGAHQLISADLIERHVLCAEMDAQRLRQAQGDPAGLTVDHQRGDTGATQLISHPPRASDSVRTMGSSTIGHEHQQWAAAWVAGTGDVAGVAAGTGTSCSARKLAKTSPRSTPS